MININILIIEYFFFLFNENKEKGIFEEGTIKRILSTWFARFRERDGCFLAEMTENVAERKGEIVAGHFQTRLISPVKLFDSFPRNPFPPPRLLFSSTPSWIHLAFCYGFPVIANDRRRLSLPGIEPRFCPPIRRFSLCNRCLYESFLVNLKIY